jgi:hypothetical protein
MLDIVGAVILASGFIFRKPSKAVAESTPTYGYNLALDASLAAQTADAQVGALLLVLGFAVQMVSALGWHRNSAWLAVGLAIGSAVALDALALLLLFGYWRPRQLRAMLYSRLEGLDNVGDWWPALAAYGDLLKCPLDQVIAGTETIAAYGERILGAKKWRTLTDGMKLSDVLTKLRRDIPGTPEYEEKHRSAD